MKVYFDNAATTRVRDEAIDAMTRVMRDEYGNPSSTHYMGRHAASTLADARKDIAGALGVAPDEVYFTSGGTEANNWAVLGVIETLSRKGNHIITSAIEHDSVIEPMRKLESMGWDVTYLMPDSSGRISLETFADALRDDTAFASVMLVNNETGVINPVGEFAQEIKRRGLSTVLHTDAVQGFCKIPFTVKTIGAQLVTVSAHKIHGPKGVGALYAATNEKLPRLLLGGGQEREKRAGTENAPSIAGFGTAAKLGLIEREETSAAVSALREYIVEEVAAQIPEAVVIGDGTSPFILSIALPGHKSEVLMSYLEGEGICVSKSAACKKGARSRTLEAMRLKNDVIDGAIRLSLSRYNTMAEAEYFVQTLKKASESLFKAL